MSGAILRVPAGVLQGTIVSPPVVWQAVTVEALGEGCRGVYFSFIGP